MRYSTFQLNEKQKAILNEQVQKNPSYIAGDRKHMNVIDRAYFGSPESNITCEILEYDKLIGQTNQLQAQMIWFMQQQNIRCRQINFTVNNQGIKMEQGALSYMQGPIEMTAGVNFGDLIGKAVRGMLIGEKMQFPEYRGSGIVVLEPSFKFFIIIELQPGETIVCDKGMFYCSSIGVDIQPYLIRSASGAMLGSEGVFQTALTGPGLVVLESPVPLAEIQMIHLENDVLKVDGNFALLRTGNIQMTVERSAKTLTGQAIQGEGLLNVFRGTGDIWIAPSLKIYQAIDLQLSRGGNLTAVNMNTQTGRAR